MKRPDKKRSAIYSLVALMLCTAVYLNWSYTTVPNGELVSSDVNFGDTVFVNEIEDQEVTSVISDVDGNSFATAKLTRTTARDEAISILNETISSDSSTEEAKNMASESIAVMSSNALAEGAIETVMSAKGFDESVVYISDDGVNVLVSKLEGEFTETDAAIIKDVVMSETDVTANKIKIIETN
ncbi:MAG: SpoIIIAH-like family protein [Clostridia bacterium]